MQETFLAKTRQMLARLALVSSAVLICAPDLAAHEVDPTVADMHTQDGTVTLALRITLESFVAGVDLDAVTDTNDAPQAERHDELRGMDPEALEAAFATFAPKMLDQIALTAGPDRVALRVVEVDIPPIGDPELPRLTRLVMAGDLPGDAQSLRLSWPEGYGTLILRQIEVEDGYTGFLSGGQSSPEIALPTAGGFLDKLWGILSGR